MKRKSTVESEFESVLDDFVEVVQARAILKRRMKAIWKADEPLEAREDELRGKLEAVVHVANVRDDEPIDMDVNVEGHEVHVKAHGVAKVSPELGMAIDVAEKLAAKNAKIAAKQREHQMSKTPEERAAWRDKMIAAKRNKREARIAQSNATEKASVPTAGEPKRAGWFRVRSTWHRYVATVDGEHVAICDMAAPMNAEFVSFPPMIGRCMRCNALRAARRE